MNCGNCPFGSQNFCAQGPTDHYTRLRHIHNSDRNRHDLVYDDAQPKGDGDQSGKVNTGDPLLRDKVLAKEIKTRRYSRLMLEAVSAKLRLIRWSNGEMVTEDMTAGRLASAQSSITRFQTIQS